MAQEEQQKETTELRKFVDDHQISVYSIAKQLQIPYTTALNWINHDRTMKIVNFVNEIKTKKHIKKH